MKKTPGKTPAARERYWTKVIVEARQYPQGVTQYCVDKGVSKDNYYQWFKRLKGSHPEWKELPKPNGKKSMTAQSSGKVEPETQVLKDSRRRFPAEFKERILKETDNASTGEVSSILRREGLYASHLQKWRADRAAGSLTASKRGPKANPLTAENKRLRAENERLQKQIRQQTLLIDLQKKVAEILNVTLPAESE